MILSIFIYHHIQVGVWCQVVTRPGVPLHPFFFQNYTHPVDDHATRTTDTMRRDEISGSSSESEEPPAKTETPGKYKPPKRPHALCGICLKGPESNKKIYHEAYNS